MDFNIRPLNSNDYDNILLGWWEDWEWVAPPKDFLPQNGEGGIIILDGDVPICAGFLYASNSNLCWVDWIISNKQYRKKPHRTEAIRLLLSNLTTMATNLGFKYSYALIKHRPLIEKYEELGYVKGDNYQVEMIKKL